MTELELVIFNWAMYDVDGLEYTLGIIDSGQLEVKTVGDKICDAFIEHEFVKNKCDFTCFEFLSVGINTCVNIKELGESILDVFSISEQGFVLKYKKKYMWKITWELETTLKLIGYEKVSETNQIVYKRNGSKDVTIIRGTFPN